MSSSDRHGQRGQLSSPAALLFVCLASASCQATAIGVLPGAPPEGCDDAACGAAGAPADRSPGAQDAGSALAPEAGVPVQPAGSNAVQPAGSNAVVPCGMLPGALIDDFEMGNLRWIFIDDGAGTRDVPDGVVLEPGGPARSFWAAHTAGSGFNTWGAFVETSLPYGFQCAYDLRAFAGVRFAVKAGGQRSFRVELPMLSILQREYGGQCDENCGDWYGVRLTVPISDWVDCTLSFADLRQDGYGAVILPEIDRVTSIRIHFTNTDQPFDLRFDNIELVSGVPATRCVPFAGGVSLPGDAGADGG